MRVKILGSAAGGGFPQWNCGCSNCRRFRLGSLRAVPRSQAQLAISTNGNHWFLLGASPDLRYQINDHPELQPQSPGRNSPISGIVLASADLDHVLGLLLLREWQRLSIYSTATVRELLLDHNTVFRLLERMPGQMNWTDMSPSKKYELTTPDGVRSGAVLHYLSLPGGLPAYAQKSQTLLPGDASLAAQGAGRGPEASSESHLPDPPSGESVVRGSTIALIVESPSGARLAYLPGLPEISEPLLCELSRCHTILVDGTFWTDDELIRVEGHGRLASEIGHMPISGANGSLARLSSLSIPEKVYVHINNTNPILDEDSAEHRQVRESGWKIAYDGMEMSL